MKITDFFPKVQKQSKSQAFKGALLWLFPRSHNSVVFSFYFIWVCIAFIILMHQIPKDGGTISWSVAIFSTTMWSILALILLRFLLMCLDNVEKTYIKHLKALKKKEPTLLDLLNDNQPMLEWLKKNFTKTELPSAAALWILISKLQKLHIIDEKASVKDYHSAFKKEFTFISFGIRALSNAKSGDYKSTAQIAQVRIAEKTIKGILGEMPKSLLPKSDNS